MSDNLVLELLRAIRNDISVFKAEVRGDMVEVEERLGVLEQQYASISRRVDRLAGDIDLIKRRLELVDAT